MRSARRWIIASLSLLTTAISDAHTLLFAVSLFAVLYLTAVDEYGPLQGFLGLVSRDGRAREEGIQTAFSREGVDKSQNDFDEIKV